ncbi:hypothetical protein PPL_00114 [Heterostelium album PN500]|uniref:Uncharacterized protein n=1 Tax=Heterostelium pallidum (strain ATCC 26659 / Pp 5 / PN500) TaxID=670386 RepID=D3AVK1_HETP5|nr:hypothetical protein PPL_00114 [Heterostelium album PN500]EFA86324.1 hypothetical protein PPL_00114 [Heterostelium album PN500]|eukprot:XP_020438429.1 hypothetical protein PPL_00114 [Heterostelium album PN500]
MKYVYSNNQHLSENEIKTETIVYPYNHLYRNVNNNNNHLQKIFIQLSQISGLLSYCFSLIYHDIVNKIDFDMKMFSQTFKKSDIPEEWVDIRKDEASISKFRLLFAKSKISHNTDLCEIIKELKESEIAKDKFILKPEVQKLVDK